MLDWLKQLKWGTYKHEICWTDSRAAQNQQHEKDLVGPKRKRLFVVCDWDQFSLPNFWSYPGAVSPRDGWKAKSSKSLDFDRTKNKKRK